VLPLKPFGWRRVMPDARVDYCLDESGALLVRNVGGGADEPTLTSDGAALRSLGFASTRAANGNGWMVHSVGAPGVMRDVGLRWGYYVREASDAVGVDERVTLAAIGAGVGDAGPDRDNEVKAPRTRPGYPRRTGNADAGDVARDREDWTASRGAHSVHGLMQTTLAQAVGARPDLFEKVSPDHYGATLANPITSITCGVAVLAQLSAKAHADPIAAYVLYLLGESPVVSDPAAPWGVKLDDERAVVRFLAMWNDDARLRAGEHVPTSERAMSAPVTAAAASPMPPWGWALVGAAGTVVLGGAGWLLYKKLSLLELAQGEDEEEDEPDELVMVPRSNYERFLTDDDAEDADEEALERGPFLLPAHEAME